MTTGEARGGNGNGHEWWRPAALVVFLAAAAVLIRALGLTEKLANIKGWIEGFGPWGALVYILVYIATAVAGFPGTIMTVIAGALFGSVLGVLYVMVGSTVSAALSFLIARYLARDAVARWLSRYKRFRKLNRLTARHGSYVVALTRLAPIFPFVLLNYGFGLTQMRFWPYVFWSWLCMLPGTILFVVGADALFRAMMGGRMPWGLIVVLALMFVLLVAIAWMARRRLIAADRASEAESGAGC